MERGASASEADDLVQERLCSLLETRTRASFSGRGTLVGWLRRGLVHDLGRLRRSERRRAEPPPPAGALAPIFDVEGALVAHQHRPHLRAALRDVFVELAPESRRILRLIHHAGLSAQQVATLLGLHRVTVQRRLGELRESLNKEVRKRLAAVYGLDDQAIAGLVDASQHAFETTLSSILASPRRDG
jgi:RNA polymerase sigma-70 factor